jgi:hypothetical protein
MPFPDYDGDAEAAIPSVQALEHLCMLIRNHPTIFATRNISRRGNDGYERETVPALTENISPKRKQTDAKQSFIQVELADSWALPEFVAMVEHCDIPASAISHQSGRTFAVHTRSHPDTWAPGYPYMTAVEYEALWEPAQHNGE